MMAPRGFGLSKNERLCPVKAIERLVAEGQYFSSGCIRCRYLHQNCNESDSSADVQDMRQGNRVMFSVPKRHFKRAVKRNLLKRRMREAYRLHKNILPPSGLDLMFVFRDAEVRSFAEISVCIKQIMGHIAGGLDGEGCQL